MRTFFAASSVSVGPKFPVAPSIIFSQEEEAEVDYMRVVGGWLSKALLWECLAVVYSPSFCTPCHHALNSLLFAFNCHVVQ